MKYHVLKDHALKHQTLQSVLESVLKPELLQSWLRIAAPFMLILPLAACGGGGGGGSTAATTSPVSSPTSVNSAGTVLYSFGTNKNDGFTQNNLIQGSDGNFYGEFLDEGNGGGGGAVFAVNATTHTETLPLSFGLAYSAGGESPEALLLGKDGNFYGVTSYGGSNNNDGVIFSMNPTTFAETELYDFGANSADVGNPLMLIQGSDGNLYGLALALSKSIINTAAATVVAPVALFKYDMTSKTESVLNVFSATLPVTPLSITGGALLPQFALVQASDGNLYGTMYTGGANNAGFLFGYNLTSNTATDLHDFGASSTDAAEPTGGLVEAANGALYGVSLQGGQYGDGTIYSYNIGTPAESVVHSFNVADTGGSQPTSLIVGSNGQLYGATYSNQTIPGTSNLNSLGNVFVFNPATSAESVVYDFGSYNGNASNGNNAPIGPMYILQGKDGNLYGMTKEGGVNGLGTVFEVPLSATTP